MPDLQKFLKSSRQGKKAMQGNMLEKLQGQMMEMQQKLESQVYEASAGGGMVTAKVNGKLEVVELSIHSDIIDPTDPVTLADTVRAAVNQAIRKATEDAQKISASFQSSLGIPGL